MGTSYPEKLWHHHLWKYSKPSWLGSQQLAAVDPDQVNGGIGPGLEAPSSPHCSEYL